jgi:carbamate kinase
MKKIVIALGGNALQEAGKPATAEAQLEVVEKTSEYIADIIGEGYKVIIAHGNGPQVGRIVLQNEYATPVSPAMPFDVCGAMSQGYIGYHIQQGLTKVLRSRGNKSEVATVVTQVLVDRNDPKFKNPSKPIGPFYTEEEAKKIADEKGYVMKEDAGRGWRRVVASPMPVEIEELSAVKCLVDNGFVVVTVGGGGIPVIRNDKGELEGTAAVIDKDLASEKLAEDLDADALVILTAVEKVSINYKKPDQKDLDKLTVSEARKYMAEGQFAPGSMLPKVESCMEFVKNNDHGGTALITSLARAADALEGKTGTVITR